MRYCAIVLAVLRTPLANPHASYYASRLGVPHRAEVIRSALVFLPTKRNPWAEGSRWARANPTQSGSLGSTHRFLPSFASEPLALPSTVECSDDVFVSGTGLRPRNIEPMARRQLLERCAAVSEEC